MDDDVQTRQLGATTPAAKNFSHLTLQAVPDDSLSDFPASRDPEPSAWLSPRVTPMGTALSAVTGVTNAMHMERHQPAMLLTSAPIATDKIGTAPHLVALTQMFRRTLVSIAAL